MAVQCTKVRAAEVYAGSDGEQTKRYYAQLVTFGPIGVLAMNLFRAQKCSARAKVYRGGNALGSYRDKAYQRKNWSMKNLVEVLLSHDKELSIVWGWKKDSNSPYCPWVLYIDLPQGQVSFHTDSRLRGPDYHGDWDGRQLSCDRILAFCESLTASKQQTVGGAN